MFVNYLWLSCVFIVLSVQFDFVWSTRVCPALPCPALPCLESLKTVDLSYILFLVHLFFVHCDIVELNTCHITNNSYSQTKLLSMSINSGIYITHGQDHYHYNRPFHHYTTLFKGKHFYLLIAACLLYEISKSVYKLRVSLPWILDTSLTPKPISRPSVFC